MSDAMIIGGKSLLFVGKDGSPSTFTPLTDLEGLGYGSRLMELDINLDISQLWLPPPPLCNFRLDYPDGEYVVFLGATGEMRPGTDPETGLATADVTVAQVEILERGNRFDRQESD